MLEKISKILKITKNIVGVATMLAMLSKIFILSGKSIEIISTLTFYMYIILNFLTHYINERISDYKYINYITEIENSLDSDESMMSALIKKDIKSDNEGEVDCELPF